MRRKPPTSQFIALQAVIAGRFSLDREIGRGGSAVVYLARDVTLNRLVAIKLLNPDVAADQTIRQRFLREARTAGRLSQPNIVPIHAVEEHGDIVFFVMDYVDGETLRHRIRRGGMLEVGEATRILREVAWALGYAHARGITHRDVKPENIIIERETGRAIVTDFGIARHVDDPHRGEIIGTADYMSPEQAAGNQVDARSDIYSLGVTAFYAITGRLPFHGNTDEQVLMLQETQPAPSVTGLRAGVPGRLVEIIDRCLAKNPTDRFATAEELATALGDTAGALRGVPAVVDNFLRVAQHTSRRLTILAPLGGVLVYAFGAVSEFGVGHIVLFLFVSWILGFELLMPPAALLAAARNVIVQGINHDEFCEILKMEAAEVAKTSTAAGRRAMFVSCRRRLLLSAGGVALAVSAVVIALTFRDMSEASRLGLLSLGVSGIILATGTAGWAVFGMMGSHAGGLARHGVWLSPFGRRFFRLAAMGLGGTPVAERPSIRHPETLLGQAVRSALADLGGLEHRDEVAAVIGKLETKIRILRARRDSVDLRLRDHEVVEPPGPPHATPEQLLASATSRAQGDRLAVNRQIEKAIAALEAIRVDLLHIRSGIGSHDDLKSDLELACQIASADEPNPLSAPRKPAQPDAPPFVQGPNDA